MVFEGPAGIAACLRAILADPAAAIARVKSRVDPAHDAVQNAGYRRVAREIPANPVAAMVFL